jgi:class 3 adenylate cyclase
MATKRKTEAPAGRGAAAQLGFAAFLELRDSTYVWNQDAELAEEALAALTRIVEDAARNWKGKIGNFTGDGFLVLFPAAEYAVRALADVIEEWEPKRRKLWQDLAARGAHPPDDCSLMVRTGVAHGQYRSFSLLARDDVAGEAINRASRCKTASNPFFAAVQVAASLEPQQRVFVTRDVFSLIGNQADYWHSAGLAVEFHGYERPSSGGLVSMPDHIVALWPKATVSVDDVARAPAHDLEHAARAASCVDIADRLVAALAGAARTPVGRPAKEVLLGAIVSYLEALANLPDDNLEAQRAEVHCKLGLADVLLAELLRPLERRQRLDEALEEFRTALALATSEEEPEQFGAISSNIAAVRRRQAELVPPAERAHYLTEAVRALRNVLQTPRYIADKNRHSVTLGTLALVMGNQAEYMKDEAKEEKWAEVGDVLRQALAVTTPAPNPHHYASVQSDLSNALRMEARQIEAPADREALLANGEAIAREAAKALDPLAAPSRYANAQVNLGLVLLDRAQLASRTEGMLMLAEAADAFKEALKVNDAKEYWHKRATILEDLALALQLQASLLGGSDRAKILGDARRASEHALRIYREIGHEESAERVVKAIRKMQDPAEV